MAPTASTDESLENKKRPLSPSLDENEVKKANVKQDSVQLQDAVSSTTAPQDASSTTAHQNADQNASSNANQTANPRPKSKKAPKVIKKKYKAKDVEPTSPLGVLQYEIKEIIAAHQLTEDRISNDMKRILNEREYEQKCHRIIEEAEILKLTSNGDGLALIPHPIREDGKQIAIVPFGLPGDTVKVRVFKSHPLYVETDLLQVIRPSPHRNDELINCRYFGKCSGCQYQSVEYAQQLIFKKQTIENAYKFLAPLLSSTPNALPPVAATEPSPLQYSYRTKLTPHFNMPYSKPVLDFPPSLGFGAKGRPTWRPEAEGGDFSILDIEECSIGTPIINQGMKNERTRYHNEFKKYKKGATILLREDTTALEKGQAFDPAAHPGSTDAVGEVSKIEIDIANNADDKSNNEKLIKTCVTNPRQIVTEYINGFTFEFSAGEFFQNNNSILPAVTNYVKSNLSIPNSKPEEPNYLVDAYCGSGLFSITCSDNVSRVIGVEVSADSVKFAERNAKTNNIQNATFIVGKAEKIFGNIDTPANRTSVILDPPRKGCDDVFLNQLSEYHPAKIVYISCNVHSQAQDVDWFINETKNGKDYYIESIKGFDFFPQTHHVESVAVLALK